MCEQPLEKIEYKGYTIEIYPDVDALDPISDDEGVLGSFVCWHRRYDLGNVTDFPTPDDFAEYEAGGDVAVCLPLYMYDHSGTWISTKIEPYWWHAAWDAGQVGWVYVTRARLRYEFGWKKITKARVARVADMLRAEVATYNAYVSGCVYGYQVMSPDDEQIDSCWGYYGNSDESGLLDDARAAIDYELSHCLEVV